MVRDFSLDHKVRQGLDWPDFSLDQKGPIFFRGGATHYSDGEGSLTIHMVRVLIGFVGY